MTSCGNTKNVPCGCCAGTEALTPKDTANRPGLSALSYRVGTHATFLESMLARLTDLKFPELSTLSTREGNDPGIALLDAWATVADVLTFYQERIANEGFLRTATERRSILELSRLVGHQLRPGVAASAYLAFELEKDAIVEIPEGARVQSLPGPGELPQAFETSEPLKARARWNVIRPRLTEPQQIDSIDVAKKISYLYLAGTATNLKPNSPLLLVFSDAKDQQVMRRVQKVEIDTENKRTKVTLLLPDAITQLIKSFRFLDRFHIPLNDKIAKQVQTILDELPEKNISKIAKKIASAYQEALRLKQGNIIYWLQTMEIEAQRLGIVDFILVQNAGSAAPESLNIVSNFGDSKYSSEPPTGLKNVDLSTMLNKINSSPLLNLKNYPYFDIPKYILPKPKQELQVYALRISAPLFGNNAAPNNIINNDIKISLTPWTENDIKDTEIGKDASKTKTNTNTNTNTIYLDTSYDKILPDSWVVVDTSALTDRNAKVKPVGDGLLYTKAKSVKASISRAAYGITGKTTQIELSVAWLTTTGSPAPLPDTGLDIIRRTVVHAQSELLLLAEQPIFSDIAGEEIELDGIYDGLDLNRQIIVSGERTDVCDDTNIVLGIYDSELTLIQNVEQQDNRTLLTLAKPLEYRYKRDTVKIYANVVKATQGETRYEVLGSGDGSQESQNFTLKQPPLTYTSAPTAVGTDSTLHVRVNDVEWHETESFYDLKSSDRNFITRNNNEGKTSLTFGNGITGARLLTGIENIKATYRMGIGKSGNVKAGQISLLATRPLGVKGVSNPQSASGGADPENRDQARRNASLACMALDRLVSVQDYEDYTRAYAGIAKASAVQLTDGHRQLIHITIAGADDIPIDPDSDLYINLGQSLHAFGDPFQPIQIQTREPMLLIIKANIRLNPDYLWEKVEPKIRNAMLETYGFERRDLGQSVFLSEIISTIQRVTGVVYVDVDTLEKMDGTARTDEVNTKMNLKEFIPVNKARNQQGSIYPAQLALLSPDIPETLILNPL